MHIILNNASMIPLYEQMAMQIKEQIITGELKEQEVLPSVRTLAGELKISALTVKKTYDKLEEEGFIVTVHGKGSFVAPANRKLAEEARRKTVEDELAAVVEKARLAGMDREEIRTLFDIILEDLQ